MLFPHCCEDPMTSINAVSFFPDGLQSIWQRLVNLHQNSKHSDLRLPASAYLSDQTYLANLGGHKEAGQLTSTKDATTQTECGDQFFLGDLDVVKAFEALKRDHTSLSPLTGDTIGQMTASGRTTRGGWKPPLDTAYPTLGVFRSGEVAVDNILYNLPFMYVYLAHSCCIL